MKQSVKRLVQVLLFIFISAAPSFAHDVVLPVIVDTDMALDDIRAVTMLLNSETAQVPLFIASDGVRSPEEGMKNLKAMVNYFNRPDIKVIKGETLDKPAPKVRSYIKKIAVPGSEKISDTDSAEVTASQTVAEVIKSADDPVIYLCLGPLTNLARAIRLDPKIKENISFIVYYGADPDSKDPGWNSSRDMDSARKIFSSGIKIYSISLPQDELLHFDRNLYIDVKKVGTRASSLIEKVHESSEDIKSLLDKNHFYVWDEMAAIYFNDSSVFKFSPLKDKPDVQVLKGIDREDMKRLYIQSFGFHSDFHLSPRTSVIFSEIPRDPSLFREDVQPYVNSIIDLYGVEEWKACLLTNEFHRHLGIYSLVGAKMGVRAREVLEAPFDTLEVISNAGNKPPLSCMNDGLQVSTGASLGRGTIEVIEEKQLPSAVFIFKDIRLTLTLKQEVWDRVKKDIGRLVKKHGGTNRAYFKDVRELSIVYWKDLNRYELFEEKMEKIRPGGN